MPVVVVVVVVVVAAVAFSPKQSLHRRMASFEEREALEEEDEIQRHQGDGDCICGLA